MTNPYHIVRAPQLGVNDDKVTVVEWKVNDGQLVRTSEILCILETSKAVYDLHAEHDGYVRCIVRAGEEVFINAPLAVLASNMAGLDETSIPELRAILIASHGASPKALASPEEKRGTQKAIELARRLGVSLKNIPVNGLIREKDVREFYATSTKISSLQGSLPLKWSVDRKPVVIYGSGRGAFSMKECLDAQGEYEVVAYVSDFPEEESLDKSPPVLGNRQLGQVKEMGVTHLAVAIARGAVRLRVREYAVANQFKLINVIHPKSFVAASARLGKGNFIKVGAIIESNASIGDCCIIDDGVVIPHDNIIEDGCHLAPGVVLGSGIRVGSCSVLGIGARIGTGVVLGREVIVGVGASVVSEVSDFSVIEGVPGRVVGSTKRAQINPS